MQNDMKDKFILKLFMQLLPKPTRVIMTSATVTPLTQLLVEKTDHMKHYTKIEVKKEELTLQNVQQFFIRCSEQDSLENLETIISNVSANNILIFLNKRTTMHEIQHHLTTRGHRSATVSSNVMDDRVKEAELNQYVMDSFMKGEYRILLTTNLLSRGIDMRKVNLVINMEMPVIYPTSAEVGAKVGPIGADYATYLHRVGRTGRYGDQGIALNIVTRDD